MPTFIKTGLLVSLLLLGGCVPFWRQWFHSDKPNPATYSTLKPHEDWCYGTMGHVDCYPGPQRNVAYESLVNVNPPSRYPLTRAAYDRALAEYESQQN